MGWLERARKLVTPTYVDKVNKAIEGSVPIKQTSGGLGVTLTPAERAFFKEKMERERAAEKKKKPVKVPITNTTAPHGGEGGAPKGKPKSVNVGF